MSLRVPAMSIKSIKNVWWNLETYSYMYVFVVIWLLNVNSIWCQNKDGVHDLNKIKDTSNNNVLLISFDAFGWEYMDLVDTPVLNTYFKKQGVYADYILNVIPAETTPNHISLATGLYPESHGIVANEMYDPVFHEHFKYTITDPKWWWGNGVEPIWYTNEKQGGISGVIWWPGYNIKGYTPTYWNKDDEITYKGRVDLAINWLKSVKPPNFLILYFDLLDYIGHDYGFGSPQTLKEIKNIDNITGYLVEQLKQNNLWQKWNIIITSDHGMANVSHSKVINITEYVNASQSMINNDGGFHFVWPKAGMKDVVYKKLKDHHPNMQVWLKENFPEKYHYRNNCRIPPILMAADEGWRFLNDPNTFKWKYKGTHGYLNTLSSMWPIFFARGPAFKKGYRSKTFNMVDIYPLMCKLLNIEANPNNGSYSIVEPLLRDSDGSSSINPTIIGILVFSLVFALGILLCSVAIYLGDKKVKFKINQTSNNTSLTGQSEQSNKQLLDKKNKDDEEESGFAPPRHLTWAKKRANRQPYP